MSGDGIVIAIGLCVLGTALFWDPLKGYVARRLVTLIEQKLPKHLGDLPCKIEALDLPQLGRTVKMKITQVQIQNPERFKSPHILSCGGVEVTLDLGSIVWESIRAFGAPREVEVLSASIEWLKIVYERSLTTSNLEVLQDTLMKRTGIPGGAEDIGMKTAPAPQVHNVQLMEKRTQISLRNLYVKGITVEFATSLAGKVQLVDTPFSASDLESADFTSESGMTGGYIITRLLADTIQRSIVENLTTEKVTKVATVKAQELKTTIEKRADQAQTAMKVVHQMVVAAAAENNNMVEAKSLQRKPTLIRTNSGEVLTGSVAGMKRVVDKVQQCAEVTTKIGTATLMADTVLESLQPGTAGKLLQGKEIAGMVAGAAAQASQYMGSLQQFQTDSSAAYNRATQSVQTARDVYSSAYSQMLGLFRKESPESRPPTSSQASVPEGTSVPTGSVKAPVPVSTLVMQDESLKDM